MRAANLLMAKEPWGKVVVYGIKQTIQDQLQQNKNIQKLFVIVLLVVLLHLIIGLLLFRYSSAPFKKSDPIAVMVQLISASQPKADSSSVTANKVSSPPVKQVVNQPKPIPTLSKKQLEQPLKSLTSSAAPIQKSQPNKVVPEPALNRMPAAVYDKKNSNAESFNPLPSQKTIDTNSANSSSNSSSSTTSNKVEIASTTPEKASSAKSNEVVSAGTDGIAYITRPNPDYPAIAKENGEEGIAQILVEVDENGKLVSAVVKSSSGSALLDRAALSAVKKARFKPYMQNGQPRRAKTIVPIEFNIKDS